MRLNIQKTILGNRNNYNEKKFPEKYKIHQYWSRKPWKIVRSYIKRYSKEGDVILDPFVGGGVTAYEALVNNRNVIARDINPISILLTKVICEKNINLKNIKKLYNQVINQIPNSINELYKTICRDCGKKTEFINSIWDCGEIKQIYYVCNNCGYRGIVDVNKFDLDKYDEIKQIKIEKWFPQNYRLPKDADVDYVHELYTHRNLLVLSELLFHINSIQDEKYRNLLLLMFVSTTTRTINSIFINKYRYSRNVNPAGVWGEKRFWVPKRHIENNVLYYFNQRLNKALKAKKETNIELFDSKALLYAKISPAQTLVRIKENSVDFVFTDPPYADAIQYLNLSSVWNSWLKIYPEKDFEIIAKNKKDFYRYIEEVQKSVKEIIRVLKPEKYLSICFHFSNLNIWNELLISFSTLKLEFNKIEIIKPLKKSHNQLTMKGTVDKDIIITFKNNKYMADKSINSYEAKNKKISEICNDIISNIEDSTLLSTKDLYDKIVITMAKNILKEKKSFNIDVETVKDLDKFIVSLNLEKNIIYEEDYKGKKNKIIKWRINNV